jgi:hypothetical protein
MNRFKIEAFFKEFPFLNSLKGFDEKSLTPEEVDSLRVSRFDEETLELVPDEYYWDGSMGETSNWERIDFVLSDGTIIHNAVETQGESGSNYADSQMQRWAGESVLEAIDRHGVADRLSFLVLFKHVKEDWEGGEYLHDHLLTIYKPAKGLSIPVLIAEARSQAMREVRAECDF